MLEWSAPEDWDGVDLEPVAAANPASWITAEALADQRQSVPDLAFRRYHANQWTSAESAWLPAGAWQACIGEPRFAEGERVWVGVDVGGERSATAVVWVNDALHVGCEIFQGDSAILDVADLVRALAHRYHVVELAFDPWRAGQLAQELEREGMMVSVFPQSDARMMPASAVLFDAITEKRITLPASPELAQHAAGAIAQHSRRGWRISKPNSRVHIDGVIALCMAVIVMRTSRRPPSCWAGSDDAAVSRLRQARERIAVPDLRDQARAHEPLHHADVAPALACRGPAR